MGYKIGVDKKQLSLLPISLDEYIPENHICRVIDAFTEQLDMAALGFKNAECKDLGCRPYDPRLMLSLYMYGCLHRVRSSRRLEAETHHNVEVMRLMNELKPDDRTICNFRKDNKEALKKVFGEFAVMCRQLDLYGGEVEATDGTKFRANNSRKNNHNKTAVEKELTRIGKQISEYMNTLEQGDKEEALEQKPSEEAIKAALQTLRERKEKYEGLSKRLESESEVSTVDPDARLMRSGGDARKLDVCYNAQTIVDSKYHLIVDFDIVRRSDDKGNLYSMSGKAKEMLGVEKLINLADKGYYDGEDIAACEAAGTTCLAAKPKPGGAKKEEGYTRRSFVYEKGKDIYICPGQNELSYRRDQKDSGGVECRIYANYSACGTCGVKDKCTAGGYRQIYRRPHEDVTGIVDKRTGNNKALYHKRQEIVEHPFGTIKAVWGFKQFLCRTAPKVTAETALAYLAYNMRRVMNIFTERGENLAMALGNIATNMG